MREVGRGTQFALEVAAHPEVGQGIRRADVRQAFREGRGLDGVKHSRL